VDGGLLLGGLLFVLIGAYLFARSERLTAYQFELNRRVLRRVLGEARTSRFLSPGLERSNVAYGKAFGAAVTGLGVFLMIAAIVR
jgi:hypothetical protein